MLRLPRFHLKVQPDLFRATPRGALIRIAERNGVVVKWWHPTWLVRKRLLERIGGRA